MTMRKKKRLCALLLCMAMLFGCTGCGNTTSRSNNPNDLVSTAGKDVTRAAAADNVFSLNCNNDYSFNPHDRDEPLKPARVQPCV